MHRAEGTCITKRLYKIMMTQFWHTMITALLDYLVSFVKFDVKQDSLSLSTVTVHPGMASSALELRRNRLRP